MLEWLNLHDLALVERADLAFAPGLNVLTGETGAGKSLVLGSIGLLLGDRADADWVRVSAERATVEGVFDLTSRPDLLEVLRALDVETDEGRVIIRRELSRDGKGRAQVNGRTVLIAQLRAVGEALVDLHGQHEHQRLLDRDRQADFFDAWAGLLPERVRLEAERAELLTARSELRDERARWERDRGEADRLRDDRAELAAAGLAPGEDERLLTARDGLRHGERIRSALEEAHRALSGDDGGAEAGLVRASRALRTAAAAMPGYASHAEACDAALGAVQDLLGRLESDRAGASETSMSLEAIEERLDCIHRLKRKHRTDLPGLLALREELTSRTDGLAPAGEALEARERSLQARSERFERDVDALTAKRRAEAPRFERDVGARLARLGFQRAALLVAAAEADRSRPAIDPVAVPTLEFEFRPNVGEPARPLRRIASGGELSRVMLAIKSLMAERDRVAVLVFDEVDQGIGGAAAEEVGRLLRAIAAERQVLCITHLPLIAAHGARHFVVSKASAAGRTATAVRPLTEREREGEIARLLAGDRVSETTRRQARELLRAVGGEAKRGTPPRSAARGGR